MAKLKTYDMQGAAKGERELSALWQDVEANPQMIKDYIVAIRANLRQWSANTKGRSDVSHSTKKPHRQKGTGGARQGTLAAPQYKGGGVVFGPRPKFDQHVRINRKERRSAIRHLLAEKMQEGSLVVVQDFLGLQVPKTKTMANLVKTIGLPMRSLLFVGESAREAGQTLPDEQHHVLRRSVRNIPGAWFLLANQLNGYDILRAKSIIMTQQAFDEIEQQLGAQ